MSKFYFFPPWRKQFYFSETLVRKNSPINLFYHPYILLSKIVWIFWLNISLLRKLFRVDLKDMPNLFLTVVNELSLNEYDFQINVGTTGIEQKMTILAYCDNERIFIKTGTSEIAKQLIEKEKKTLLKVNSVLKTPKVLNYSSKGDISILVTEALNATKIDNTTLNLELFDYIISVGKIDYYTEKSLLFCLAHGDCCPWNFLRRASGELVLIDWELSDTHPAGYDLITYIFQTAFLLSPQKRIEVIFEENKQWINRYFQELHLNNIIDYLKAITQIKIKNESEKKNFSLLIKWQLLNNFLNEGL